METYLVRNLNTGRYDFWKLIEMFIPRIQGWEEIVNRITEGRGDQGVTLFQVRGGRAARLVMELLLQWTENWLMGVTTSLDLSTSSRRMLQEEGYKNQNLRSPLLEFWRVVIYDVTGRFAGDTPSGRIPLEILTLDAPLELTRITFQVEPGDRKFMEGL